MIIILGMLNFILSIKPIVDPDFLWHISVGKYIVSNGAIPRQDIFSWYGKLNNLEFISHEWLSDVIMYLLTPVGVIILLSICVLIIYIYLVKFLKLNKGFSVQNIIKIVWLILCLIILGSFQHRPYLFSYLLFLSFMYILFFCYEKNKKIIYIIPFIQLLWVNLHGGSSSLILIVLIMKIVTDLLYHKFDKNILIVLVLSILFSIVNPYTYKIILYPFLNMGDNTMINLIAEWASPNFHGIFGIYYFILIIIPIVFLFLYDKKKIDYLDILLYLLFLFMMLRSTRFIHYYIFISTYIIGKYCIIFKNINIGIRINIKIVKIAICVIFSILLVAGIIYQIKSIDKKMPYSYSVSSIKKLKELKPQRLFNDYNTGGYLSSALYDSDVDIFINGIADIYSKYILEDAICFTNVTCNPKDIIDKYQFDVIILYRKVPLEYYLLEIDTFEVYYEDDTAIIFNKI